MSWDIKIVSCETKKNPRTILFGGGHNDHELGTYIPILLPTLILKILNKYDMWRVVDDVLNLTFW